jgi:hypothetical protein
MQIFASFCHHGNILSTVNWKKSKKMENSVKNLLVIQLRKCSNDPSRIPCYYEKDDWKTRTFVDVLRFLSSSSSFYFYIHKTLALVNRLRELITLWTFSFLSSDLLSSPKKIFKIRILIFFQSSFCFNFTPIRPVWH